MSLKNSRTGLAEQGGQVARPCAAAMLYCQRMSVRFPQSSPAKAAALAAVGILLFAGFGCRPVLQARLQPNTNRPSMWIVEPPHFRYETYPDATGKIMLDLRTKPNTIVSATLAGPGVDGKSTQTKEV